MCAKSVANVDRIVLNSRPTQSKHGQQGMTGPESCIKTVAQCRRVRKDFAASEPGVGRSMDVEKIERWMLEKSTLRYSARHSVIGHGSR